MAAHGVRGAMGGMAVVDWLLQAAPGVLSAVSVRTSDHRAPTKPSFSASLSRSRS
jgi:homoserine acetyltransferase